MQVLIYVLFFMQSTNNYYFSRFKPDFYSLVKSKMATVESDDKWPPAAPPPIKHTSSCQEDQRFSNEGKIVSKSCNMSKLRGGVPSNPPPPPMYHGGGMNLRVYVQGLNTVSQMKTQVPFKSNEPSISE